MRTYSSKLLLLVAAFLFALTACGGDDASSDDGQTTVVVTTNILGDVVRVHVAESVEREEGAAEVHRDRQRVQHVERLRWASETASENCARIAPELRARIARPITP